LPLGLLAVVVAALAAATATGGTVTGDASRKVVYLTFDDGPSPSSTPKILTLLRRHRATATFFAVGSQVDAYPSLARRIVREGHVLGNHTYTHADLSRLTAAAFFAEVDRTQLAIRRATGTSTTLLRPPYGSTSSTVRALAAQRGYRVVMWDVDPQDWLRPGAYGIAAHVLANAGAGDVVLLHDGGGERSQTVLALDRILRTMSARGYVFRALR
jgi:peptidoglycan/xylan/chitin deacetylase (PgdA/CDA1 family)